MPLRTQIVKVDPEEVGAGVEGLAELRASKYNDTLAQEAQAEAYAAETLPAPKFTLHDSGVRSKTAAEIVRKHLALDGKPALNMATFVITTVDEEGLELCKENLTKNLADSDEYPAMLQLQERCVSIISNLWNVPDGERGVGTATTGSSEAIQLGGLAMLRRWKERQQAKGKPTDKPNILMASCAQVALEKFARYWDVENRMLPIYADHQFGFSIDDLLKNVDENTIGVFVILGSTFTGHYEDVASVARALDGYQAATGLDIPIHVDGASGGFVAPFSSPGLVWDFRLDRVKSINTSGHKFGGTPAGCGWVIWRDMKYLPESLLFVLDYLGGSETTFTLNFSRPGFPIIYQYYQFVKLGRDGYALLMESALENARLLSTYLERSGYFDVLSDIHRPRGKYFVDKPEIETTVNSHPSSYYNPGLPVVSFKLSENFKKEYSYIPQEAVSYMLRHSGYIIPNYHLPENERKYECLRVVVKPDMTLDFLDRLMQDIISNVNKLMAISKKEQITDKTMIFRALSTMSQADSQAPEDESKWNIRFARC